MDWKLELVFVPVSDVDRAKAFYADQVGFVVDHDHTVSDEMRFVQLTPPGSACSIAIGQGPRRGRTRIRQGPAGRRRRCPGAARQHLIDNGIEAGEIQDLAWGTFTGFADPDGNEWAVQELAPRP